MAASLYADGEPHTTGQWLGGLELPQYVAAFNAAGFDDLSTIAHLDTADLDNISAAGGITILPGHRKKLLLAAPRLQGIRPHRQLQKPLPLAAGPIPVAVLPPVPPLPASNPLPLPQVSDTYLSYDFPCPCHGMRFPSERNKSFAVVQAAALA